MNLLFPVLALAAVLALACVVPVVTDIIETRRLRREKRGWR